MLTRKPSSLKPKNPNRRKKKKKKGKPRKTLSGRESASRSMYAFLSSKEAGGSDGTFSTTSTQRFPSVATSTILTWPLCLSSSPPRMKTVAFGRLFATEIPIPLQLLMEDDNGERKASRSGLFSF